MANAHVRVESAALVASVGAVGAHERLLARVGADVAGEVRFLVSRVWA